MRSLVVIIFAIRFFNTGFAQTDTVYLSGKVSANNLSNKEEAVKNAIILLKLSNGETHKCLSNDTGYYFFKHVVFDGYAEMAIITTNKTDFIYTNSCSFIGSKDVIKISFQNQ